MEIVLVQPEIPHNTGCAARLAAATGLRLHLVEPLGFAIDEKAVRRAGLDYWKDVDLHVHPSWEAAQASIDVPPQRWTFLSARSEASYTTKAFGVGDVLVFGRETTGLGPSLLAEAGPRACTIPLFGPVRSLNLSTAVGIVVYEALRQMRPAQFPPPVETS